jgi:endonuclease/exonuclease/phosphatase family metal-dependent hydrolase
MSQPTETGGGTGGRARGDAWLTVATLNTRGVPVTGTHLPERYQAIGEAFDACDADVVAFQEVFTYWHLRLLARRMSSFPHVVCRPSAAGPAGGVVMFSRLPVSAHAYRGFGFPPRAPGVSWAARARAWPKGILVAELPDPGVCVMNTHPLPNRDGDWSRANRFFPLHQEQLSVVADVAGAATTPAVVCGDFNVDRDSPLMRGFLADTGLADAFGGQCPATFHAEFLGPSKPAHCIDFILVSPQIRAGITRVLLDDKRILQGRREYLSDHTGLYARLHRAPDWPSGWPGSRGS